MNFSHSEQGSSELSEDAKHLYNTLCEKTKNDFSTKVKINNKSIHRSFGKIVHSSSNHKLGIDFFKTHIGTRIGSWNDIRYSNDGVDFGLTTTETINGIPYTVVKVPGIQKKSRSTAYVYSGNNQDTTPPKGGVVFLYRPKYDEVDPKEYDEFT